MPTAKSLAPESEEDELSSSDEAVNCQEPVFAPPPRQDLSFSVFPLFRKKSLIVRLF